MDKCESVSCVYPDIIAVPFFVQLFLCLNRSYKSYHRSSLFHCRMDDQSIIISVAQSLAVVSYINTSNHPTPSDPSNPPSSPRPQSKMMARTTSRKLHLHHPRVQRCAKLAKIAVVIAKHVRGWLANQMEQERNEFEANG